MPNSPAHTDAAPPSLASLDEQIVAAIAGGCAEFHAIAGAVRATATLLARAPRPNHLGVDEPGRLIDKRLQSLRKAGDQVPASERLARCLRVFPYVRI
jgi:hypothetical protein